MKKYLLFLGLFLALQACKPTPFTTEAWTKSPETRHTLITSLLEQNLLPNLNRQELEALLGRPDDLSPDSLTCVYYIGYDKSVLKGGNQELFEIELDASTQRVKTWRRRGS